MGDTLVKATYGCRRTRISAQVYRRGYREARGWPSAATPAGGPAGAGRLARKSGNRRGGSQNSREGSNASLPCDCSDQAVLLRAVLTPTVRFRTPCVEIELTAQDGKRLPILPPCPIHRKMRVRIWREKPSGSETPSGPAQLVQAVAIIGKDEVGRPYWENERALPGSLFVNAKQKTHVARNRNRAAGLTRIIHEDRGERL